MKTARDMLLLAWVAVLLAIVVRMSALGASGGAPATGSITLVGPICFIAAWALCLIAVLYAALDIRRVRRAVSKSLAGESLGAPNFAAQGADEAPLALAPPMALPMAAIRGAGEFPSPVIGRAALGFALSSFICPLLIVPAAWWCLTGIVRSAGQPAYYGGLGRCIVGSLVWLPAAGLWIMAFSMGLSGAMDRTSRAACQDNLHKIGVALRVYGFQHGGALPASLDELVANGSLSRDVLICPTERGRGVNCSYAYIGGLEMGRGEVLLAFAESCRHGGRTPVLLSDGAAMLASPADLRALRSSTEFQVTARRTAAHIDDVIDAGEASAASSALTGYLDPIIESMEKAAASGQGETAICMRVVAGRTREMRALAIAYFDAAGKFTDAGSIEPLTLRSRAALRERLALLATARSRHGEYMKFLTSYSDELPKALADAGISPAGVQRLAARMSQMNMDQGREVQVEEGNVLELADRALRLLDRTWETTEITDNGTVQFETDEQVEAWRGILQRIDDAHQRQDQAQKVLRETLKRNVLGNP